MPPPPKSPTRLSGGTGASPFAADGVQRAGQRDVVDVVAGGLGQRAVLAEAGHAAEDQAWVGLQAASSGPSPSRSMTPGRKPSMQGVGLGRAAA